MIWPRLEVFQLCTPQYSIFSRSLSPNLTLFVSRELFKHVGFDNQLTYDKWVIVARSHLKWNDYCIQFFWDILCLSIWYIESDSRVINNTNSASNGVVWPISTYKSSVDIYHLIILLVIHTSDAQARSLAMNQHHTYDAHVPWQHAHNSMDVINPSYNQGHNNSMQRNGGNTNNNNGNNGNGNDNMGGSTSPNKNIFRLNTNIPYDNDPPRSPLGKGGHPSGTNSSSPTKSPGSPRSPTRSHLGMLSPKLSKTPQQHLDSLRHKFPILLKALSMESDSTVMEGVDVTHQGNSFGGTNTLLSPTKHGNNKAFGQAGGLGSPGSGGGGPFGGGGDVKLPVRCIRALDLILDISSIGTSNNNEHSDNINNSSTSIHDHLLAAMDISSTSGSGGSGSGSGSVPLGELEKWFDKNLTINDRRYPLNTSRDTSNGGLYGTDDTAHDASPPSFFSPSKANAMVQQEGAADQPQLVFQGRQPRVGGSSVATRLDEGISMPSTAQQKAVMDFADNVEGRDVHNMPLRVILPLNRHSLYKDCPTVVHNRTSSIFFLLTTQLRYVTSHLLEGDDLGYNVEPVSMNRTDGDNAIEMDRTGTGGSLGSTASSMPSMRKIGSGMSLSGEDTATEDAAWNESETEDSDRNDTVSMASPQASPYPYSDDEANRDMAVVGHTPEWKQDDDEGLVLTSTTDSSGSTRTMNIQSQHSASLGTSLKSNMGSQLGRGGVGDGSDKTGLPQLHLSHCYRTTLYFLAPFSHITISNCYNCDIIIGACSGAVVLSGCEKVRCSVVCRKMIMYNCFDCVFNIAALSPSIISGDSRHLSFGPHNVSYTHLNLHLEYTGLTALLSSHSTTPINTDANKGNGQKSNGINSNDGTSNDGHGTINCWNLMHDMSLCLDPKSVIQGSPSGYALDAAGAARGPGVLGTGPGVGAAFLHNVPAPNASVAALLPPQQFAYVAIPHESEYRSIPLNSDVNSNGNGDNSGSGNDGCIPIPEEYRAAWKHRSASLSNACRLMNESMQSISHIQVPSNTAGGGTSDGSGREGKEGGEEMSLDKRVSQIVANKFLDWLTHSGKAQQVMDLVHMDVHNNSRSDEAS